MKKVLKLFSILLVIMISISNVNAISNVSGHTTAVLSLSGTDATSGVAGYTLACGSTTISSGTTIPATFNLTSANSMVEGMNTLTLTVTDVAGNSNSATCQVQLEIFYYFNLSTSDLMLSISPVSALRTSNTLSTR